MDTALEVGKVTWGSDETGTHALDGVGRADAFDDAGLAFVDDVAARDGARPKAMVSVGLGSEATNVSI